MAWVYKVAIADLQPQAGFSTNYVGNKKKVSLCTQGCPSILSVLKHQGMEPSKNKCKKFLSLKKQYNFL